MKRIELISFGYHAFICNCPLAPWRWWACFFEADAGQSVWLAFFCLDRLQFLIPS
jgi:hypothetical protein